jgi:hypothetical protein
MFDRPPSKVLTPQTDEQPSRMADVVGVGVLSVCPHCRRTGRFTVLLLAPLNIFPNQAVICGDGGCGVYWGFGPAPPQSRFFDEGGHEGVNP